MKPREIRTLTDEELRQRLQERLDSLQRFRIQLITGTVDNVRAARNTRRDIARIKTIMRERELERERASRKEAQ
ncbi:MAG TPA: 50S ribosomal protein L29 [Candidatus Hydrogenedentes bacterium]|nr:50S ribosomal protein L29 [Candidatus Hydrogenedentota bacterium]HOL77744.1 50S ribosomal protein L29 [Candidatus Hydrogenedentota bacterium]HPO86442.1 50S ribosomal protein L29 [Candidatus Hydrogenedentota bacterium]